MKFAPVPLVKDQETNRALQSISQVLQNIARSFLGIYTLPASLKASVATKIEHKLGRVPVGFFVVDCAGDVRVWRAGVSTGTTITLQSSVDATVTILIF